MIKNIVSRTVIMMASKYADDNQKVLYKKLFEMLWYCSCTINVSIVLQHKEELMLF